METVTLSTNRFEADRLWRKYKQHRAHQPPLATDLEIERIYRWIARGRVVIRALESIRKAGLGADGLPKLAIARADATHCHLRLSWDREGRIGATMQDSSRDLWRRASSSRRFEFRAGEFSFAVDRRGQEHKAIVPLIPPDIRPARGLANYHILWEAVWTPEPPVDPMLLRRIGKGDTWLVCGAWDLTDVERAVLADRIAGRI